MFYTANPYQAGFGTDFTKHWNADSLKLKRLPKDTKNVFRYLVEKTFEATQMNLNSPFPSLNKVCCEG